MFCYNGLRISSLSLAPDCHNQIFQCMPGGWEGGSRSKNTVHSGEVAELEKSELRWSRTGAGRSMAGHWGKQWSGGRVCGGVGDWANLKNMCLQIMCSAKLTNAVMTNSSLLQRSGCLQAAFSSCDIAVCHGCYCSLHLLLMGLAAPPTAVSICATNMENASFSVVSKCNM